jgi:hypothetical protein
VDLADLGLAWPFLGLTDEHGRDVGCLAEWTSPWRWFASHLGPLRSRAVLAPG